jgi:hypothetical protein
MNAQTRQLGLLLCSALFIVSLHTPAYADENTCAPPTPGEAQHITLQQENAALTMRVKQLEAVACIPTEQLHRKKVQRLREIAADVKTQRQTTSDFQGFVMWMSSNLAGYNRYISAGSYAATIGRMLPIPYAGQVSIFTKFIAQFTLALNASSVSITNYLNSSRTFIAMTDQIEAGKATDGSAVMEAARFADQRLLKDMGDAQTKLATVSDLSSGALSFLGSLNHYLSGADEYWNKTKGFFKKDVDVKEKSFISESTSSLKSQADSFNNKLKLFDELGKKETASVKSLAVYDELEREAARGGLLK